MSRSLALLLLVIVLLVGGVLYLSTRTSVKEPTRVEKVVPLENLAK